MRVLWLTNIPSPYRVAFFSELGKLCDLTVLFERRSSSERHASWSQFEENGFRAVFLPGISVGVAEAFCPKVIGYLKRTYDHIVVTDSFSPTGFLAVQYMRLRKIPYEIEGDGAFWKEGRSWRETAKRQVLSHAALCFSSAALHDAYYLHYGVSAEKIARYPFTSLTGADFSPRLPEGEKQALRASLGMKEKYVALAVGQFIPRKGYDVLIEAAAGLPDTGVYLVGGDPPEEYLALREKQNAKNVHFVPFHPKQELRKYYQAADVFVHPTREDIWGLVINEALANGLPVITTDRCIAGTELVKNGVNGYLVSADNAPALADRMRDALRLKNDENGAIRDYTVENMANVHMKIWGQLD